MSFTLARAEIAMLSRLADERGMNRSTYIGVLIRAACAAGVAPSSPASTTSPEPATYPDDPHEKKKRSNMGSVEIPTEPMLPKCPTCGSPEGMPCMTDTGFLRQSFHAARRTRELPFSANATAERLTREMRELAPKRKGAK